MTPKIRQSFETLERQKARLLSEVLTWSAERAQFRPEPTGWSTLDVLDHLVKVEKAFLRTVQNNLPDGHPVTYKDRIGALFIIGVMRSPMHVKVPASATTVLPGTTTDSRTLSNKWDETRGEMAGLLTALLPSQFRAGLFRHPVSGWMTVSQAMAFLSAHLRHHGYQLNKLRSATREL